MQQDTVLSMQHFLPTPSVYTALTEEEAVLLDGQTGTFLGFNTLGTAIWTLLTSGNTLQEVVHTIGQQHPGISSKQVQTDVCNFFVMLIKRRLIAPDDTPSLRVRVPLSLQARNLKGMFLFSLLQIFPLVYLPSSFSEWLEAWLSLQWVDTVLQQHGLLVIAERLHTLPALKMVRYGDSDVLRLAKQVQSAANWQRVHAVCLHQCLALCLMLRRRGIHAEMVIGVAKFPFFAHAWLISGSDLLNDAIQWEVGLGLDKRLQRLQGLSLVFRTADHKNVQRNEGQ